MYKEADGGTKIIYALIILAGMAGLYSIFMKKQSDQRLMDEAIASAQKKLETRTPLTPTENYYLQKLNADKNVPPPDVYIDPSTKPVVEEAAPPTPQELAQQRSQQAVATFSKDAHISIQIPKSFSFHNMDLDGGFAGIYGENAFQKAKVTGLAYPADAKPEQAVEFMKKEADNFPNLAKNPITNIGQPTTVPPQPGSGFSGATLWDGKLQNGDQFSAIMMNREDKKGTYLFVISGPQSFFTNNDGGFDYIYDQAKALSPEQ